MNCLYITLFFNIVAGVVQTFIKSWDQLLYPRVLELCRLPFEPRYDFFFHFVVKISPSFGEFTAPLRHILPIHNVNFALKNRMTERTSHLTGLWIGAAVSDTSQSNKAGSTNVKRSRLTCKESRSMAVLP